MMDAGQDPLEGILSGNTGKVMADTTQYSREGIFPFFELTVSWLLAVACTIVFHVHYP